MAATAATGAELPLEYLASKFASDSDDDTKAAPSSSHANNSSAAPEAQVPAATAEQPAEDAQWADEEDWTDSDDEELAAALEWADSREGTSTAIQPILTPLPGLRLLHAAARSRVTHFAMLQVIWSRATTHLPSMGRTRA